MRGGGAAGSAVGGAGGVIDDGIDPWSEIPPAPKPLSTGGIATPVLRASRIFARNGADSVVGTDSGVATVPSVLANWAGNSAFRYVSGIGLLPMFASGGRLLHGETVGGGDLAGHYARAEAGRREGGYRGQ